jgi:hypothetical protein
LGCGAGKHQWRTDQDGQASHERTRKQVPGHSQAAQRPEEALRIPDAETYDVHIKAEIRAIMQAHAGLFRQLGPANTADPFLIAVGKSKSAIVVTDEKVTGPKHESKIPFVCKSRNVGHAGRSDYLKVLGVHV